MISLMKKIFPFYCAYQILFLVACEGRVSTQMGKWKNPITSVTIEIPQGWDQSSSAAKQGATTIGFFTPVDPEGGIIVKGRYGYVTFHYEDMRHYLDEGQQITIKDFVKALQDSMKKISASEISKPVYYNRRGMTGVQINFKADNRGNEVIIRYRIWTSNNFEYWYTSTESLRSDSEMERLANPLIERLESSTILESN